MLNQNSNYNLVFKSTVSKLSSTRPRLLLHACCAPCSSHVLTLLKGHFEVAALFYNPNIYPIAEHERRMNELQKMLSAHFPEISIINTEYLPEHFYDAVKGLESFPEGGNRCIKCYALRLKYAAEYASQHGFKYYTTTLSISPHKNARQLNKLGGKYAEEYGIEYLYSDFKKEDGYKKSVLLSEEYGLYRQQYCGCEFSKKSRGL